MKIGEEMKRLESAILTINEVLGKHISMTRSINNSLFDAEKKISELQAQLFEQEKKTRRNNRFLMVEMILLWMFAILSAIEIVHLRG